MWRKRRVGSSCAIARIDTIPSPA
ncbi:hypothetical protein IL54_2924 [Sphingobium sp. ba1]|nr:hypothetical protein IL54_2924 [Sphingobium sp. ba1]